MKHTLLPLAFLGLATAAMAEIKTTYEGVDDYTDFSYAGSRPAKTQPIFERELQQSRLARYVGDDRVLELNFTDIDLAGDIQPWRNSSFADIRYVESVYPPRMKFSYVLRDSDGNEIASGEEKLSDLGFDFRIRPNLHSDPFDYDLEMLSDWARKTLPKAED